MNSLAMRMSGPCGRSSMLSHHCSGAGEQRSVVRLRLAQHGARLDQRDGDAVEQSGHAAEHAKRVGHQRAAPRSKLGDDHRGLAHGLPDCGGPDAKQLAEHLADLGRGDEVAVSSDRLPRRVIAGTAVGEAGLHIVMHADRPVTGDPLF